ncbi:MAG: hypothetical protein JRF63_04315, partial [Deltaproteobacteria bacterium]|nr:hypothetical protein [Deltaproteobacteria bacterium]
MTDSYDGKDSKGEGLNLAAQRDEFLDTFFRKGAEFASELLDELETLKTKLNEMTLENAELRHHLASDDAIRELLVKIDKLEAEKKKLRSRAEVAVREIHNYEGRYSEVERELDSMANLYVASYQLHATLETSEVLSVIEQVLMQFVGVGSFSIYLVRHDDKARPLEPVHAFQCEGVEIHAETWGEGPIGEAAATGVYFVNHPDKVDGPGAPLACIPMVLGDLTIG